MKSDTKDKSVIFQLAQTNFTIGMHDRLSNALYIYHNEMVIECKTGYKSNEPLMQSVQCAEVGLIINVCIQK